MRAFALVPAGGKVELFVEPEKVTRRDANRISQPWQKSSAPKQLTARLKELKAPGKRVRFDPDTAAFGSNARLAPRTSCAGKIPCILPKAIKNEAEIAGTRAAHMRDGAADRPLSCLARRRGDGRHAG